MNEKIEILIVHCGGEGVIKNCLQSIKKNTKDYSIMVLLNGCRDKSEELIKKSFKEVKLLKSEKLIGFSQAVNFLVKNSSKKSEYIVLLNNDVEVGKNWLEEMIKTMKKHKNCVGCQPKIKSYYKRDEFEYAGAAGGFIDVYGFPFCRGRIFNSVEKDIGQYDDEKRIFWGCGVCLLVKRDFFIKNGMFDEDFYMYAEETDFWWRTNLNGKEIWFTPKSEIYHIGSFSVNSSKINLKKEYWTTRNHILILLKNYSILSIIKILPQKIFLETISALRFPKIKGIPFARSIFSIPILYITKIHKKRRFIQKNRRVNDKDIVKMMDHRSIALEYFLEGKDKFDQIKIG